jgi:hypothetical protein
MQSVHAAPVAPQTSSDMPDTHVGTAVDVLQQPPLHGTPVAHVVVQTWALQASPGMQSFSDTHSTQAPEQRSFAPPQVTHSAPPVPHALGVSPR